MRLDLFLAECGLSKSRTHAQNLIKLGKVIVDGTIVSKASLEISGNENITVDNKDDYASLGGLKLQKAINHYKIDVNNKICIDIGASNGGFTDVLLRGGASKVYAVDIGECALPQEMVEDDRVVVKDKLNARYLTFEDIGIKADIITIDVSFISLTMILPALMQFTTDNTAIIALIKPQFEVGRASLTKTGIVKNQKATDQAIKKITDFASAIGLYHESVIEAPHPFENKNKEYLVLLHK